MSKRKGKEPGLSAKDAAFDAQPGMQRLDAFVREIAKIPKAEIDRREAEYQAQKAKRKAG